MTTLGKHIPVAHPAPLRAPARTGAVPPSTFACFESEMRMIPGVNIDLRSMYVAQGTQGVLISPVGTAEEASIVTQRPVTLVAPSLLHHLHLSDAIARYQPAALWGPPGLSEKRPDLGGIHVFGREAWPFAPALEFALIQGAPVRNEVVLFHRPSRTIYTADLVFNVHEASGLLAPIAMRLMGIHNRFAVARMWKYWVKDRAAFQHSIEQVLAWDFERIVMAHGDIVVEGGASMLERALRDVGLFA